MRLKRKILIALVMIVILAVLWPLMLHHRAMSQVEKYRKQLAAQGEKLTVAEIAPHPTADEQASAREALAAISGLGHAISNFPPTMKMLAPGRMFLTSKEESLPDPASSNLWPELQSQIERNSRKFDDLRAALKGLAGQVNLDYSMGAMLPLPHLAIQKRAALCLCAASLLELHQGQLDQSCEDLKACLALSRFLEHEPIMISQLVRMAVLQIALGQTWEILQHPGLQDKQLAELQSSWESIDPMSAAQSSLEMERHTMTDMFKAMRENDPRNTSNGPGPPVKQPGVIDQVGEALADPHKAADAAMDEGRFWLWKWQWSYEEELCTMQMLQAAIDSVRQMKREGAFVPALKGFDAATGKLFKSHANASRRFMLTSGPSFSETYHNFLRKLLVMEAERRLLVTAIALKRFQLAHQKYPEDLKELTPTYLAVVPGDAMDGKPLRYHRKDDGTFLLYSVGEDGVDNGGNPVPLAPTSKNISWTEAFDIVWPMPATPDEVEAYKKKALEQWNTKMQATKPRETPRSSSGAQASAPANK
ncbi:MAG TPA: hypothetical protein VFB72_16530 [Verrucomicrobiae bacterium]|nr:hypothetical protein [Verrucomicrobiae bacterium]